MSGGGYRAALVGGGVIKAFDSRTEGTEEKGQLGGLLQSSTYFSALSGGSWLLGSIYMNNFTSVSTLREKLWDFTNVILMGPAAMSTTEFWTEIATQIEGKKAAGFPTTDVDPW